VEKVEDEKMYDIEAVIENGTYGSEVTLDILQLMMQADVVTIRGTTLTVHEVEVTDQGVIRFHGNSTDL
jgi:hypothetical protein